MTVVAIAEKFPWRLGKHQRAVVEYLVATNREFVARAERYGERMPDWKRGGAAVTRQQLASLCRFELWSEAANLLDGMCDRGILAHHPTAAMYTLSQIALEELGFRKPTT